MAAQQSPPGSSFEGMYDEQKSSTPSERSAANERSSPASSATADVDATAFSGKGVKVSHDGD